jgi:hypothetical protein
MAGTHDLPQAVAEALQRYAQENRIDVCALPHIAPRDAVALVRRHPCLYPAVALRVMHTHALEVERGLAVPADGGTDEDFRQRVTAWASSFIYTVTVLFHGLHAQFSEADVALRMLLATLRVLSRAEAAETVAAAGSLFAEVHPQGPRFMTR